MFGINKNGTKHKIGIIMPAFFPASRVSYDNSQSGLTADDAQEAIDEVNAKVDRGGVSVTADGTKTFSQLFDELYATANLSKITRYSHIVVYYGSTDFELLRLYNCFSAIYAFSNCALNVSSAYVRELSFRASGSKFRSNSSDDTNNVPTSGWKFILYY